MREYPALPLLILRERNADFPHPRGYTVIGDDSTLAALYDTFTAHPTLREMTLEYTNGGSITYG